MVFPPVWPCRSPRTGTRPQGARSLYQGPWFHGFTLLRLPPKSQVELEFALTYARWGGVPAASHAQLCLIGWGTNQRWDQAAIGSWGESITYDPDICLNRSMIDDVRPLMVWGMDQPKAKWSWTNNVGGGDFLVYVDPKGKRQYLTRMRAWYASHGPNLTDVTYAGVSADGAIAARLNVLTPRSDDINRAIHRIRYDVLKPTPFRRLAFYQVGADNYNDHQFTTLARGDATGLAEEWEPPKGGRRYSRSRDRLQWGDPLVLPPRRRQSRPERGRVGEPRPGRPEVESAAGRQARQRPYRGRLRHRERTPERQRRADTAPWPYRTSARRLRRSRARARDHARLGRGLLWTERRLERGPSEPAGTRGKCSCAKPPETPSRSRTCVAAS